MEYAKTFADIPEDIEPFEQFRSSLQSQAKTFRGHPQNPNLHKEYLLLFRHTNNL
jgi:hypothetical protein